jgi:hypothetical protein
MRKDYFDEIFKSSKTVIVPGLGSFTKNESDGKISFNPYLKFNDGFLAGFIAKKQGTTIDDAGKSIADSVDKINAALSEKGEALVLGLGVMKKGADGKITFVTDQSAESKTVAEPKKEIPPVAKIPEKPIVEPPKVETKKEEPKKEIPPVAKEPEKPVAESPKAETIKSIEELRAEKLKKEEIKSDIKVEAPILTSVDAGTKDKKQLKEEAQRQKEEAKELARKNKEEEKKKKEEARQASKAAQPIKEKKERKKRRVPIWFILFIVLAAGGGTFAAIKWDMVKGWLGIDKSTDKSVHKNIAENREKIKEKTQPAIGDSTVADDTATIEEPVVEDTKTEPVKEEPVKEVLVKETPIKETPVVNTPTGTFHVICGNFQSQELANKMVDKLNAEGNQAMNLGNRGGFFMVSAGSFSTMEEANAKRQALSATHPKAYIYNGL